MIVTCPACETRYLVDEAELGGEAGRRVRCASCGNLWHYSAEAAAIHLAVAAITAELTATQAAARPATPSVASNAPPAPGLRAEPGTQVHSFVAAAAAPVRPAATPMPYVPPQRPAAGGTWLATLALVATLAMIVILGRDNLIALYPPIAGLYRTLHMAAPTGTGSLQITSTVTHEADRLTVAGDIVNTSRQPQPLTRLRVTLRDGARRSLEVRFIAPPMALLPPGLTAYYSTTFERPSITAASADVAFAAD